MRLLDDNSLERSTVVANCLMNRDRILVGSNGYSRELGFNPLGLLKDKTRSIGHGSWLDLCCGSATALIEAAGIIRSEALDAKCEIVGVDLVGMFLAVESFPKCVRLLEANLTSWRPDRTFDLITCVHGLHYIGDKLGLIARAASWLNDDGYFAANLDLNSIKYENGRSAIRFVSAALRRNGLEYNARRKLVTCIGPRDAKTSLRYLGANDQAGPNYTGQAAVDSYYQRTTPLARM